MATTKPWYDKDTTRPDIHDLFKVVVKIVGFSCGDGDCFIVAPNTYEELANMFELWADSTLEWWFTRANNIPPMNIRVHFPVKEVSDGHIIFRDSNQSISFVDSYDRLPRWNSEIVIKLY